MLTFEEGVLCFPLFLRVTFAFPFADEIAPSGCGEALKCERKVVKKLPIYKL